MELRMKELLSIDNYKIDYRSRAAFDPKVMKKIEEIVRTHNLFEKSTNLNIHEFYEERITTSMTGTMKEEYSFNMSVSRDGKDVLLQIFPITNIGTVCLVLFAQVVWTVK